ncbi:MAG: proton-conducting transporter membrane subunit [Bacillota bacterium]|nr:proton-conducting transporter membrane subunit [Bacillota bacterium]
MYSSISAFLSRDWLTIYFSVLILLILVPVFIYSKGYIDEYKTHYSTWYFWTLMILFCASMLGVVAAGDSISFLVFWELMSLFSFFLIIYEYRSRENIKIGIMYFIMTHISGLLLICMFILLRKYTGSTDFQEIAAAASKLTGAERSVILLLAMLGFGAKAGLLPVHAWLPKAHPSAPSNISALMSGVMLKIALYGFIRTAFQFLNGVSPFYAGLIMLTGVVTAVYSVINALLQKDIKKLLAYSSAENIGIIFCTLGLALLFNSYKLYGLGIMALTAALFHILNHAVFKSLLFTGAGSVLYATSTKDMNKLGGLYKKMKFAASCMLIGTAAISAIPPLNGFASEILILRSFVEGAVAFRSPMLVIFTMLCGMLLAFTGGGVIWSAVKCFGMTFLGEPRSEYAVNTHKIPKSMNVGMGILSVYAVILGVFSPIVINIVSSVASDISGQTSGIQAFGFGYEITIVSGLIIIIGVVLDMILRLKSRNKVVETYETWGCGFDYPKPFMQYSPDGYSQPMARFSGNIAGYKKEVNVKDTVYLKQKVHDVIEKNLYSTVIKAVNFLSEKVLKIHYGKIQVYISYIFISLILALVLVIKFV